jgi:5'(3')-deoxyribonucleotidase
MDGVVANLHDFMSEKMFGNNIDNITEVELAELRSLFKNKKKFLTYFPKGAEHLFYNLPPFPYNKDLINTITTYKEEYCILSRPSNLDLEGTKRAKINWVKNHLSFNPPKDIILVYDKTSNGRASSQNVLIDDWDSFLNAWREKGGHAIKYVAREFDCGKKVIEFIKNNLESISNK